MNTFFSCTSWSRANGLYEEEQSQSIQEHAHATGPGNSSNDCLGYAKYHDSISNEKRKHKLVEKCY